MSVAELLHSNLCLLGYEREASASKIVLSDETFEHANERAFQSVVHFLLRLLDEDRCRLTFRHCWPVLDKKQSAVFRQAVVAWLREIRQTDPDGGALPQINPSLLLSPGGRRFKDLLLALTQFVMVKTMQRIEPETPGDGTLLSCGDPEIQCGTLRAACAIGKERFLNLQKTKLAMHSEFQRFADVFSAQYRRLRQSTSSLTVELGRLVAASDLPPELTHRLLQEGADSVVPAVYAAARQHLASLVTPLDQVRSFCREAEYSWGVAESIVSGAVDRSVVDGAALLAATHAEGEADLQSSSSLAVDGKLDLVAFFDTFIEKVERLTQFVSNCPVENLKGLHGSLPPLVREASQLSSDAGRLLSQLQAEADSVSRRLERLLAAQPPPPPPAGGPLLAPRTPNWSLAAAPPPPPPGDHPLKHLYRTAAEDGAKEPSLDVSSDAGRSPGSSRLSNLTTVPANTSRSPWASPVASVPTTRLTAPTPPSPAAPAPAPAWPAAGGLTPGAAARSSTALSSCSSLFSPVCGETRGVAASPGLGSVSSLAESVVETARPGGDATLLRSPCGDTVSPSEPVANATARSATASPGAATPSPQVLRLRERTSAFLRSLTRSPVPGGDCTLSPAPGAARRSPLIPLELSVPGGETREVFRGAGLARSPWRGERLSRSGPSSPLAAGLPRVAWQEGNMVAAVGFASPAAVGSPVAAAGRRRTRSGPGAACSLLDGLQQTTKLDGVPVLAGAERDGLSPGAELSVRIPASTDSEVRVPACAESIVPSAAESQVRAPAASESQVRTPAGAESEARAASPAAIGAEVHPSHRTGEAPPTVDGGADFSRTEDQMAEALALSVFGPGDFSHSLDFSHRESLGGVELSLVQLDDSDCTPGPGPARVEPPTDLLIDI